MQKIFRLSTENHRFYHFIHVHQNNTTILVCRHCVCLNLFGRYSPFIHQRNSYRNTADSIFIFFQIYCIISIEISVFCNHFICQAFFIPFSVTDSHLQFILHFLIIENIRYSHVNKFCFILCLNTHIGYITHTGISIFSIYIFLIKRIQIYRWHCSLVPFWNGNSCQL